MPNCGSHVRLSTNWKSGIERVEAPPQEQRRRERDERDGERQHAHRPFALGTIAAPAGQQHQQRADQRQKNYR